MTMHGPQSQFQPFSSSKRREGILSKLGFAQGPSGSGVYQDSLNEIGAFLDHYRLPLNPQTLSIAYDCITQTRGNLRRKLDFEVEKHGKISPEWLAEISPQDDAETDGSSGEKAAERLADALESSILDFSTTVEAAESATQSYGSKLKQHSKAVSNDNAQSDLPSIVDLLHGIVSETVDLEKEIRKAREETKRLQDDLEKTKRMAEQDYLTGLLNRRSIDAIIAREGELARMNGQSFAIAMCDLDNFKQINDGHGHETGDRLLKLVSKGLRQLISDHCFVGRFGGDEFIVVFRATALESAAAQLDRVRVRLNARKLVNKETGEEIGSISFSAGLAQLSDGMRINDVLEAADGALYEAKRMGRNRLVTG